MTDIPDPAIIGLPTSTDLNLLQYNCAIQTQNPHTSSDGCLKDKTLEQARETILMKDKLDLITQYPECFNGIRKFQGEYHITVHPNVPPVIDPPRRVLISFKDDIKLNKMIWSRMFSSQNLKKVNPHPWLSV